MNLQVLVTQIIFRCSYMAKFKEHQKALELRKHGKSYSQIKKILGVSKSSLSLWLRNYPLSKDRIRLLRDWNESRIEKYRETRRKTREARLDETYRIAKGKILPLSKKALHAAGLFLYWGEGGKSIHNPLCISNTDPSVMKFSLFWMTKILKIPKERIKFRLHLYSDMDIDREHYFWQNQLSVAKKQFRKPYIKKNSAHTINYRGFGHGTCEIYGGNVRLKEQILMEIKAIHERYKLGQ